MAEQPPPSDDQPPPSYQPPPPSNPNPLIPQGPQQARNFLAGINPRIWVGVVIGIVVIVVLLFWSSQQRGANTADQADRIALEQTSTQNAAIFMTLTFSAITPTIDPQLSALETQNALLVQGATNQVATSQAVLSVPTLAQMPLIITATALPQIVQPTQVQQIVVQPTSPPIIITATLLPQAGSGSVATVAGQSGTTVCPPATNTDYSQPTTVTISGRAIVHPWWNNNKPSWGQEQVRLLLEPGQTVTFIDMMGRIYGYQNSAACAAVMTSEFANASFRIVTIDELGAQGLVQIQGHDTGLAIFQPADQSFGRYSTDVTVPIGATGTCGRVWQATNGQNIAWTTVFCNWKTTTPAPQMQWSIPTKAVITGTGALSFDLWRDLGASQSENPDPYMVANAGNSTLGLAWFIRGTGGNICVNGNCKELTSGKIYQLGFPQGMTEAYAIAFTLTQGNVEFWQGEKQNSTDDWPQP